MATENAEILEQLGRRYDAGFITDIESDSLPPGLDEDVVRALSAKKNEPEWMTEWRLAAYRHWLTMPTPHWATKARYIPGQVWAGRGVNRNDINPRPLSDDTPSNGLIGCFSRDESMILASALEVVTTPIDTTAQAKRWRRCEHGIRFAAASQVEMLVASSS